jgi:hypothetical protein
LFEAPLFIASQIRTLSTIRQPFNSSLRLLKAGSC